MKAFIFDLDNTLFDRYATIERIFGARYDEIRRYLNPGYNRSTALAHFCALEQLYNSYGWRTLHAKLCDAGFFNIDDTPSYEAMNAFLVESFEHTAVPFEFTRPTLEAIRGAGYATALITNGSSALQRAKLKMLGLSELFDVITVSGEYSALMCGSENDKRYAKPSESIFTYTVERLGLDAGDCAYVGDNPLNDIVPAASAGLVPIWIRSKSPWIGNTRDLPRLCFDDVRGLLDII